MKFIDNRAKVKKTFKNILPGEGFIYGNDFFLKLDYNAEAYMANDKNNIINAIWLKDCFPCHFNLNSEVEFEVFNVTLTIM